MRSCIPKFFVLAMTAGMLFQLGGCVTDLVVRLLGVLLLDQFVGPIIGDPAGDLFGGS